jgi:hypothetical protein
MLCGPQRAGRLALVVFLCLYEQRIKPSGRSVDFKLPIPGGGVELNEPAPEFGERRRRQSLHGFFEGFDVRHGGAGLEVELVFCRRQATAWDFDA